MTHRNQNNLGKLPPQAVDLEEMVLGAVMLERDALGSVIDFLRAGMFYMDKNQKIFDVCLQLFADGRPIDIGLVTQELRANGQLEMIGGAYYITELTNRVASAANIEFHARIILQKFLQREMIRLCTGCIQSAYEDTTDVLELMDLLQVELFKLNEVKGSNKIQRIDEIILNRIEQYKIKYDDEVTGIRSGINPLDKKTNGWQNGDLIIIAARPGMGKTAFVLTCAASAAKAGIPTLVDELEMSAEQLGDRVIASETDFYLEDLIKHHISDNEIKELTTKLKAIFGAQLFIDDTPGQTIVTLRSKAIQHKKKHGLKLLIVDYLQLMEVIGDNREAGIGSISRGLKKLAKELEIPIIALSQLSREVEKRQDKTPKLSDLRESGSIEQDADLIIFLLRPEYYGVKTMPEEGFVNTDGLCLAIIAKHRNGNPGDMIPMKFNGALMQFSQWEADGPEQQTANF
jgi:replicative DNA helicase